MSTIDAAVEAILTPIPNSEGARDDARRLRTKLLVSNVSTALGSRIDWGAVLESATEEMREVEKDLNTASYLLQALWRVHGPLAAARGLAALATLVGNADQPLSPSKPIAQKKSFDSLLSKLGGLLSAETVTGEDRQAYEDLLGALDDLRKATSERIEEKGQPDFDVLRRVTIKARDRAKELEGEELPTKTKQDVEDTDSNDKQDAEREARVDAERRAREDTERRAREDAERRAREDAERRAREDAERRAREDAEQKARQADEERGGQFVDPAPEPDEPPPVDLAGVRGSLWALAESIRDGEPASPAAHRLLRVAAWLGVESTPADGRFAGRYPSREPDWLRLTNARTQGQPKAVVTYCAALMLRHPLCLDLQYFSAQALEALGDVYRDALQAATHELRALLARVPGVPNLVDSAGTPMTSDETRRWIADAVLPRPAPTRTSAVEGEDEAALAELPARLRGDERLAALIEAQSYIDTAPSGRQRFQRQLAVAEASEAAGLRPVAAHLFTSLAHHPASEQIATWDPALYSRALAGLARNPSPGVDVDEVLARLGVLDVAALAEVVGRQS